MSRIAKFSTSISAALFMLSGCIGTHKAAFPPRPDREPLSGFEWRTIRAAGLEFWAQTDSITSITADDSIPDAITVSGIAGGKKSSRTIIRIFPLPDGNIESVIVELKKTGRWDEATDCAFREVESSRKGVRRYVLEPAGGYAESLEETLRTQAVPSTCSGWGVGNSGMRYFEIHDRHPDKAVFVEIGQEQPLFDPKSIVFEQ